MTYHELHEDFVSNSRNRWRHLVKGLADDDPARLQQGKHGDWVFNSRPG